MQKTCAYNNSQSSSKAAGIIGYAVKSTFIIICVQVGRAQVGLPTPMTRGTKLYTNLLHFSKILIHVSTSMRNIRYGSIFSFQATVRAISWPKINLESWSA